MSIPRKDGRYYLDPAVHAAMTAICNQRGIAATDYVESLIVADVLRVAHEAIELAEAIRGSGLPRIGPDSPGAAPQQLSELERIRAGQPPGARR